MKRDVIKMCKYMKNVNIVYKVTIFNIKRRAKTGEHDFNLADTKLKTNLK